MPVSNIELLIEYAPNNETISRTGYNIKTGVFSKWIHIFVNGTFNINKTKFVNYLKKNYFISFLESEFYITKLMFERNEKKKIEANFEKPSFYNKKQQTLATKNKFILNESNIFRPWRSYLSSQ